MVEEGVDVDDDEDVLAATGKLEAFSLTGLFDSEDG